MIKQLHLTFRFECKKRLPFYFILLLNCRCRQTNLANPHKLIIQWVNNFKWTITIRLHNFNPFHWLKHFFGEIIRYTCCYANEYQNLLFILFSHRNTYLFALSLCWFVTQFDVELVISEARNSLKPFVGIRNYWFHRNWTQWQGMDGYRENVWKIKNK